MAGPSAAQRSALLRGLVLTPALQLWGATQSLPQLARPRRVPQVPPRTARQALTLSDKTTGPHQPEPLLLKASPPASPPSQPSPFLQVHLESHLLHEAVPKTQGLHGAVVQKQNLSSASFFCFFSV